MKLLLYCTKAKPYLYGMYSGFETRYGYHLTNDKNVFNAHSVLNGKIVAECDFEVEEIKINLFTYKTDTLCFAELCEKSCLDFDKIYTYFLNENNKAKINEVVGYAIHIKNLHIFDKPRDITKLVLINQYRNDLKGTQYNRVKVAPQNMCIVDYAIDCNYKENIFDSPYILISIRPEWLCKILNGEKTIEVRKKVLKEMLKCQKN